MHTERRSSVGPRPTAGTLLLGVILGVALLPSQSTQAHDLPEQRQVIASLSPEGIDLLVAYELPAGRQAMMLRDVIDMDRSGAVDSPLEQIAQAQLLHARVRAGLDVVVDGAAMPLLLERLEFRDGAGEGPQQGFEGMVLFRVDRPFEVGRQTRVGLYVVEGAPATSAEVQLLDGVTLVWSTLPAATDVTIIGPAEVLPDLPLTVVVQREQSS